MKRNSTIIRNKNLQRLRALAMVERRIHGASIPTLCKEFNMHRNSVERVLSYAEKANLLVKAEDRILEELVPDAIALAKRFMKPKTMMDAEGKPVELPPTDKEAAIALRLLESALPAFGKKQGPQGRSTPEEDDLYTYVSKLRNEMVIDGAATSSPVLEGQIQGLLPAATESDSSEGLPATTGEPEDSPAPPSEA